MYWLVDYLWFPTTLFKHSTDPLLLPLMMLSSHESETHYYPLTRFNQRRILLHAHSSAPFSHAGSTRGLNFTIHSSGTAGCSINLGGIDLRLDWKTTFGRWASRYFTVIATWSVGVVAVIIFNSWGVYERTFGVFRRHARGISLTPYSGSFSAESIVYI